MIEQKNTICTPVSGPNTSGRGLGRPKKVHWYRYRPLRQPQRHTAASPLVHRAPFGVLLYTNQWFSLSYTPAAETDKADLGR